MEVLAAEFPDIFTQYIEIVPEIVTETKEVSDSASTDDVMSKTVQDIFLEHDYGQRVGVQEDANKNFSKTDFENTVFSTDETRKTEEKLDTWSNSDQLDEVLEDLRQCDEESNSNILLSLEQEKSSLGCNWTSEYSSCDHGPVCPFTFRVLELDKFPDISSIPAGRSVPSVVVLRNTPAGYVKVPVTEDLLRLRKTTAQDYNCGGLRLNDITNQRTSYRPPANTVLIKVPGPAACQQCDTTFSDNKSLVKHTRNQHQVYQCSKCGESTVGYYRMASHAKK